MKKTKDSWCNIIVVSQYSENYNLDNSLKPFWKDKGVVHWELPITPETVFTISDEILIDSIKEILKSESNEVVSYTYVEHEVRFGPPMINDSMEEIIESKMAINE